MECEPATKALVDELQHTRWREGGRDQKLRFDCNTVLEFVNLWVSNLWFFHFSAAWKGYILGNFNLCSDAVAILGSRATAHANHKPGGWEVQQVGQGPWRKRKFNLTLFLTYGFIRIWTHSKSRTSVWDGQRRQTADRRLTHCFSLGLPAWCEQK